MNGKKHIKTVFFLFIVFLPLLISTCYSPPRNQFVEKEVVVNISFGVAREAVVEAMTEKNILFKAKETPTTVTVSGNLLVDVAQYADCGKYYGKRITGYADMDFVILVQRINRDKSGIQIISTVTITESDIMLLKERRLPCISNGRMEEELLDAVMQKVRERE
ncbi:MAG TPA: hypothetical protein ACFYD6_02380 [Candidatus Brocadiia bacterium]|nr:hypothetical protein [Candidatus Brocadiales bacterium]